MINKPLLTEQLKRFWPLPAIASLLLFFAGPLPILTSINDYDTWNLYRIVLDTFWLNNFFVILLLIVLPLAAVFLTMMNFVSKNEMTAFYSFPTKKSSVHFTNAVAGVILTVIPILLFCLVLLFPIEYREPVRQWRWMEISETHETHPTFAEENFVGPLFPGDAVTEGGTVNTVPAVAVLFARMLIIALFNFAVFWFAFSLSGHGVIALLLSGAIPLLALIFPALVNQIVTIYVFGAPTNGPVFSNMAMNAAIPAFFWWTFNQATTSALNTQLIVYSLVTIALSGAALFISGKRKAENTGNSIMFNPVKNLLIFLVSLSIGVIVALISWGLNMYPVSFYLGLSGGFIVGYFISQMIAEKSFSIGHKVKYLAHFCGALVVIYAVFFLFTQFGMGFYVNRVPQEDRIVGVLPVQQRSMWWGWRHENIKWQFVTDPEVISLARHVHENIISERARLRQNPWNQRINPMTWGGWGHFNFSIEYLLDDGSIMQRHYSLPPSVFVRAGITELLSQREVILLHHQILDMPELIIEIGFDHLVEELEHRRWHRERRYSLRVSTPETIGIIAAKLQDYEVARRRLRIEEAFYDTPVLRDDFVFVEIDVFHSFEIWLDANWDLLHAAGIWSFSTGFHVSEEFFYELVELLHEMGYEGEAISNDAGW